MLESTIKMFVANFIIKDKRERVYLQLCNPRKRSKFVNKLNHNYETVLEMTRVIKVSKELDYFEGIQKLLKFKDDELCYIISNYDDTDDQVMLFKPLLKKPVAVDWQCYYSI